MTFRGFNASHGADRPGDIIALIGEWKDFGGCPAGSSEEQWLAEDLRAHPASCTLAYWHEPLFSSGAAQGNNSNYRDFWADLYRAKATIVQNGHDHDYERLSPQDPDGKADSARGIPEFVVGTGGNHERPFAATPQSNSEVRMTDIFGVLKLALHPRSYDWDSIPEAGKAFQDAGSDECHRNASRKVSRAVIPRSIARQRTCGCALRKSSL